MAIFIAVANGDIRIYSTELFVELSSTFHMNSVQIAKVDWMPVRQNK